VIVSQPVVIRTRHLDQNSCSTAGELLQEVGQALANRVVTRISLAWPATLSEVDDGDVDDGDVVVARVFLSYAGADLSQALEVFGWLSADGHDIFFDRDVRNGIPAGEVWKRKLYQELSKVDAVVCLVTHAYVESMWCTAEIAIADSRGCRLIPLRGEPGVTHRLIDEQQHTSEEPTRGREQTLAALRRLDSGGRRKWRDGDNPYPGLEPFTAAMSGLYFGRSTEIRDLAAELRIITPARAVAVVGPSGCGKSSLLRAGLVPHLDSEWVMVGPWSPEDVPCYALAKALTATARGLGLTWTLDEVSQRLAAPSGLRMAADELLIAQPAARHVLVALDQAEDLFAAGIDAEERARFAELIRVAFDGPVRLVLTVRSEYYDELSFLAPVKVTTFRLGALERPMLRSAIEEPARIAGLRLTPELSARLVDDTDTGDALPLLAFTLNRLAEGRSRGGDAIDLDAYDALGGLKKILAKHADDALAAATTASGLDKDTVMAGLVRMVSEDDTGRRTRRRIASAGLSTPMRTALAEFVNRRLVVSDGAHLRFVHDALLTAWPALASAVDQRARTLRAAVLVEQAAADWVAANDSPGYLWDARRFAAVVADLGGPEPEEWAVEVDEPGRRFLVETRARVERDAQQDRRKLVRTLVVVSALLVMVLVAGVIAVVQARVAQSERDAAQSERDAATIRQLVARAESVRVSDPQLALRLGLVAEQLGAMPATSASLLHTLTMNEYAATVTGHTSSVFAVAFSPDGKFLAAGDGDDHTVRLWDVTDLRHPEPIGAPLTQHTTWVTGMAFTPNGHTLATANRTETILWDVTNPVSPRARTTLSSPADSSTVDDVGAAFSANGALLATTHGGELRLFDTRDPNQPKPLGGPLAPVTRYSDVSFSTDGRYLAASFQDGDTDAAVWQITDPTSPVQVARFQSDESSGDGPLISTVTFAPRQSVLAVAVGDLFSSEARTTLWRISDGGVERIGEPLTDHADGVRDVAFDTDGKVMATVGEDGRLIVYDISSLDRPRIVGDPRVDHTNAVYTVAFGPSGQIATGGADNKIILWAPVNPAQPTSIAAPALTHSEEIRVLAFGPDGHTLAAGAANGITRVWDVTDPAAPRGPGEFTTDDGPVGVLAFRPNGSTLAVGAGEQQYEYDKPKSVTLWDVSDPLQPRRTAGPERVHKDDVLALQFSPDGNTLWSVDSNVAIVKWDTSDPQAMRKTAEGLTGRTDWQDDIAIRPDGRLIASRVSIGGGAGGVLRDVSNLSKVKLLEGRLADYTGGPIEFSPNGGLLATGGTEVLLWDVTTPWRPRRYGSPFGGTADELAISPDGLMLAVSGDGGAVTVWSIADQSAPFQLGGPLTGHPSPVTALAWTPDSRTLATADTQGNIRLWDVSVAVDTMKHRIAAACARAIRGLDTDEWNRYVGPDLAFQETCK
jgi:WD40 repeat protein